MRFAFCSSSGVDEYWQRNAEMESLQCRCPCSSPLFSSLLGHKLGLQKYDSRGAKGKLRWGPRKSKSSNGEAGNRFRLVNRRCHAGLNDMENHVSFGETNNGISRRQVVLGGLLTALSLSSWTNSTQCLPLENLDAMEGMAATTAVQVDEINAYSYIYPMTGGQRMAPIRWVESRKPERYSSAAPLAPDARQRIVSERLNVKNNLVVSVSIGPPNFNVLKTADAKNWDAKDVALSVLTDKSTSRKPTGQRVAESSILSYKTEEKDGTRYFYYEYVEQKSPTLTERSPEASRHCIAVTAEREGFFYTLNASSSGQRWSAVEPLFRVPIQSFRLQPTTREYVPPYKDPWRFW